MMRIHTKAFAISGGIVVGGGIFAVTFGNFFFGLFAECVKIFASLYPGYTVSVAGSVVGALYGFITGALICGLFSVIYNRIFIRL